MGEDMSIGELSRIARDNQQQLRDLPEKYVVRREYEKDQQNTDRRLTDLVGASAKTEAEVEQLQKNQANMEKAQIEEQAKRDKERNDQASARRWQIFLLVAAPIFATMVAIYFSQGSA